MRIMTKKQFLEWIAFDLFILLFICFKSHFSYAQTEYTASGQRDPFESQLPLPAPEPEPAPPPEPAAVLEAPKAPVTPPPDIAVEGIVSGGHVPQAVIQKKVVHVGDTIGGARISKITKEGVEVVYEGESFLFPAPSRAAKPGQGGRNVLQ